MGFEAVNGNYLEAFGSMNTELDRVSPGCQPIRLSPTLHPITAHSSSSPSLDGLSASLHLSRLSSAGFQILPFSRACVLSRFSRVRLFATPWTVAY